MVGRIGVDPSPAALRCGVLVDALGVQAAAAGLFGQLQPLAHGSHGGYVFHVGRELHRM